MNKISVSVFRILACFALISPAIANDQFCHNKEESWIENANTGEEGVWVFKVTPGAMAPARIPLSCFQRPIKFASDGTVSFPEPGRFAYNAEKCRNDVGEARFSWTAEFNASISSWGLQVTALSRNGEFSTFAETRCLIEGSERTLVLSPSVIDGKVGEIHFSWRPQ